MTRNSAEDVVRAATAAYLAGRPLDMSALAADLGLSRATLYRRIGNHDALVGMVLAEQTERTFRACADSVSAEGLDRVRAVFERFMYAVIGAEPLRAFIARDPLLFIRIVLAPGHVEQRATALFAKLLAESGVDFALPPAALAQAIVRIGDSFMYTHLLGGHEPETDNVITLVNLLLDSARAGSGRR
ncbi:QsdR family transcriptional regulator [Kutzneria kofuensis]|uniref:AcrR family transcriptional regulator n=1 Tax=Kutzneria kofuensis TaxID=103725 RepID=A0A7W9KFT7_9PSEU|nr:QsdR family transcriptional regulator [Kutzneria kofuensis]MBB5891842.1 AcrR family transcriptional regulator [Kutzneria kofuensis]